MGFTITRENKIVKKKVIWQGFEKTIKPEQAGVRQEGKELVIYRNLC